MKKAIIPTAIIVLVLLFDQVLKIWIKLNMYLGQEYHIFGEWFRIHFTENEGMAFGMTLGGDHGKIALSIFRIVALLFISIYLFSLMKKKTPPGLVISIALIFSGALGNILDSVFYGVIFSDSIGQPATLFPPDGGYSTWFHGKVVDMFYFPVFQGYLPDWIPFWGDEYFIFFRPVFNIADAAITIGVFMIIIFQKRYFKEDAVQDIEQENETKPQVDAVSTTPAPGASTVNT